MRETIVDCGPLLAFLDPKEDRHFDVVQRMRDLPLPLLTVESVLSEVAYLLRRGGKSSARCSELVASGMLEVVPIFPDGAAQLTALMNRYSNVPMSLADAGLVRLSELYPQAPVFTYDSDFLIYRRNENEVLPLLPSPGWVQEEHATYAVAAPLSPSTEKP